MKSKSIKSKVMAGLIMAGILISTSHGVSAANIQGNMFKTQLDVLVTAGTITADQETAIEIALTPSKDNRQDGMTSKLDALVTAGTITAAQETAIEIALTTSNDVRQGEQEGQQGEPGGHGGARK